jgi:triosephosphate isomerase
MIARPSPVGACRRFATVADGSIISEEAVVQLVVGNWKMNGTREKARELASAIARAKPVSGVSLAVAPPFVYLETARAAIDKGPVALAAQSCAIEKEGAFTGEVSAEMLGDVGCTWVIVGHSERRALQHETDDVVAKKVAAGLRAGLRVIACVGETLAERDAGKHEGVCARQIRAILEACKTMARTVIAYEPVWAIGTGRVATPQQAREMHERIRATIAETLSPAEAKSAAILYGGSVKPENMESLAAEEGIDGALVGGASLDARSFLAIAENAVKGEAKRRTRS